MLHAIQNRSFDELKAGVEATRSEALLAWKDKKGNNPLYYSSLPEKAKLFLDAGLDVNSRNGEQQTPLITVCMMKKVSNVQLAKFFLDNGADVSAKDMYGNTALHYAAMNGHIGLVMLLLSRGARGLVHNNIGKTPRDYAESESVGNLLVVHKMPFKLEYIDDIGINDVLETRSYIAQERVIRKFDKLKRILYKRNDIGSRRIFQALVILENSRTRAWYKDSLTMKRNDLFDQMKRMMPKLGTGLSCYYQPEYTVEKMRRIIALVLLGKIKEDNGEIIIDHVCAIH